MERATTKLACAGALLALASVASAHPGALDSTGAATIVKVKVGQERSEILRLMNEGYDIAGVNVANGTVDVVTHSRDEGLSLKFQGFSVVSAKEVDLSLAPDQNYKTPQEVEDLLKGFARDYPAITRLENIGKSGEGRDMWALKISDNPERRELDEPAVLFNAEHHAREVMTPEVALDIIEQLVTGYGRNGSITRWVDGTEIWVVPMVNPDGSNKVWSGNSMWRKNAKGGYGVDINRNYPYAWNTCSGSSGSTWADDYRGPSAGSESETQNLMGLVSRVQPVFDISFHSYSELVIFPYGCSGRRSETRDVVEPLGREMAAKVPSDDGKSNYTPGTAWELLYNVDGGDIDWMYNVQHVIPYVIEVNSDSQGFQPPYRMRQPTVEKLRGAWQLLLDRVAASGVRGTVTDGAGRAQPNANLKVESLAEGADGAAPVANWKVKNDGTYHIVLNPGMYKLTFELNGRVVTKDVTVGAERVDMNVEL